MTALEMIMLVIGIVCFVASFILTKDDEEPVTKKKNSTYKPELTKEQINMIKDQVEEIISNQMAELEESTEGALDKISNTKILEMGEYVETVLNDINKNHNETVFMYDMLNEKAKEVKVAVKTIGEVKEQVDNTERELKDSTIYLEGLIRDAKKSIKEMDIAIKAAYKTKAAMDASMVIQNPMQEMVVESEPEPTVPDNVITPQFFEEKNTAVAEEPAYNADVAYMPKAEPESNVAPNCNEQILMMHAEGKSNLEIAKTLNLGMGEVKLVIDLFNKRR